MAGDWIKVQHTLPDKEEVNMIAVRLGIDHDAVVGKLLRVWIWADLNSVNGNGLRVTESFLDRLTNCPGFALSLIECGWLITRNGRLSLPNFDRHNGQTAKNRALTASRVKRLRNDEIVTEALPEKRREEKRREESKSEDIPLPPSLDTDEFRKAWSEWKSYRREKRSKLTPTTERKQLAQLATVSAASAIATIEKSIAQGWSGLFIEGTNGKRKPERRIGNGQLFDGSPLGTI